MEGLKVQEVQRIRKSGEVCFDGISLDRRGLAEQFMLDLLIRLCVELVTAVEIRKGDQPLIIALEHGRFPRSGQIKDVGCREIAGAIFPEAAVVGVEAAKADVVRRLRRLGKVFRKDSKILLHLRLHGLGGVSQIRDVEQLPEVQIAVPHVLIVDMHQAGLLHGEAQLCQHVDLISNVLIIDRLRFRGALDLVEFHPVIAEVFQYVHAAKEPFIRERRLRNDGRAGIQQLFRLLDHLAQVSVGNLHVVPEQPHRQVPDLAAGLQNGLVHNGFIKLLRLVLLQPEHFRTLHAGAVF